MLAKHFLERCPQKHTPSSRTAFSEQRLALFVCGSIFLPGGQAERTKGEQEQARSKYLRGQFHGGSPTRRNEDGFGNHHVHAFVAVDELGDVEIGRDACEHVGVIA
jgi:hypothetical protein